MKKFDPSTFSVSMEKMVGVALIVIINRRRTGSRWNGFHKLVYYIQDLNETDGYAPQPKSFCFDFLSSRADLRHRFLTKEENRSQTAQRHIEEISKVNQKI